MHELIIANKSYKTTYFMDLNAVKVYTFGKFNYLCTKCTACQ